MADQGFLARLGAWLAGPYIEQRIAEGTGGVGDSIDSDEDQYSRLTGGSRDLNPVQLERAQRISMYLWRQNPMAHRLTEMLADFVIGDGINIEAKDENVQTVLDEFWNDPQMGLANRHRDLVRDQSIYGELAFRIFTNKASGRMALGIVTSDRIVDVVPDPENALLDKSLLLKNPEGGDPIKVAISMPKPDSPIDRPEFEGDAFYFGINRLTGQHRGTPDLLAVADFVDGYDQLLFNSLERSSLINSFIWDVTLVGGTEPQVAKWAQDHPATPAPGTVRVHNDKEVWKPETPSLGNVDTMALGRSVKNMALGGLGAPEAWFAEGDSANRATLAEQSDPTYRMVTRRQADVCQMFKVILGVVVAMAIESGRLKTSVDRTFTVSLPEPSAKDSAKTAATMAQVAQALTAAKDAKWISTDSARKVFLMVTGQLGLDIDPTAEEELIEEEAEEEEAEQAVVPGEQFTPGEEPIEPGEEPEEGQNGNGRMPPQEQMQVVGRGQAQPR